MVGVALCSIRRHDHTVVEVEELHGSGLSRSAPSVSRPAARSAGRWVCVTRSGGSIHDLRGYNLTDQTRSLKVNRNDCG